MGIGADDPTMVRRCVESGGERRDGGKRERNTLGWEATIEKEDKKSIIV